MSLTLDEANRAIAASVAKARSLNIRISAAVCDAGGRLVAFQRMDGAIWASAYGSQGKAIASAAFARPSGELSERANHPTPRGIQEASGGAMIMGQAVIAFPVLTAFALAAVQGADPRAHETAISLGASPLRAALTTLLEVRFAVVAGVFNGFGRVISEVGCAMMVGGNIAGVTRNIPTAIALETSKGDFAQGIALGAVLMLFALGISITLALLQGKGGLK